MEWKDDVWDSVDVAVAQLEKSWKARSNPGIAALVPPIGTPGRELVLITLVKIDLEYQWRAGVKKQAESYLQDWPELAQSPDAVVELVDAELRVRAASGTPLQTRELENRFPDLAHRFDLSPFSPEASTSHNRARTCQAAAPASSAFSSGDMDARTSLAPGATVGHYRIREKIGQGGMSIVYLAEDVELKRPVVLKCLRPELTSLPTAIQIPLKEGRAIAGLNHPGIVQIYDVGTAGDGTNFLVMEYVEGQTLEQLIQAGPLPPNRAASLAVQIAAALGFAHQHGFIHRDVKPANVLLDRDGNGRITDFGLAVHENNQHEYAGDCSGTWPYMAPEQIRGESHLIDGRADIWALGVLLYEMLSGRRPFRSPTTVELREEILTREPKPLRQIDPAIPRELEVITLRCLSKKITDRYATSEDVSKAIRRWQNRGRISWVGMLLAAAAVVVLIAAGLSWNRSITRPPLPPPLDGSVDVVVWGPEESPRRGLLMSDTRSLPLRQGDKVRIQAALNRSAYMYAVWIDSKGTVSPVFPWKPGVWQARPSAKEPRREFSLPENQADSWPMEGPTGMETVVLLARESPLPRDVDLRRLIGDVPSQSPPHPRTAVWFHNGKVVLPEHDRLRGPKWFEPQKIDDSVYRTQQLIYERLRPHFDLIVANVFAHQETTE